MERRPVAELRASPQIREFIKGWETLRLSPYCCSSGAPTIGWGHTKGVKLTWPPATVEQAQLWFDEDAAQAERLVQVWARSPLTQAEFDALVSFAFNTGPGAPGVKDGLVWLKKRNGARAVHSTLLTLIHAGRYREAAGQFPLWANGRDPQTGELVKLPGLVKRRAAEQRIFAGDAGGYGVRP